MRVPPAYWQAHPTEATRLRSIVAAVDLDELDPETQADVLAFRGNGG